MSSYLYLALAGDAEAPGALATAGVGLGPLAADREPAPVAEAAVGPDLHQPFDVLRALAPEVTLDFTVLDRLAKFHHLVLGQVFDRGAGVDARLLEDLLRRGAADSEDVGEPDFGPFVDRDVDARDACHANPASACDAGSGRSQGPPHFGGLPCTSRTSA